MTPRDTGGCIYCEYWREAGYDFCPCCGNRLKHNPSPADDFNGFSISSNRLVEWAEHMMAKEANND